MSLTRNFLAALGIDSDKADEIINAHVGTVDSIKKELDEAKDKADRYDALRKEKDKLSDELKQIKEDSAKEDTYKVKYEALKEDFDKYKKDIESSATKAKKEMAYRELLKEVGISDKRIESVLKVSNIDDIELDKDGNVKNRDDLKKDIVKEWEDFITVKETKGADTKTPPKNEGGGEKKSKDEIMAIKDTAERQKAIAENHELFGF